MNDNLKPTVIDEIPFPSLDQVEGKIDGSGTKDIYTPQEIKPISLPKVQNIKFPSIDLQARAILSPFAFGKHGAIEIGNYSIGAGVRISPNGIVGGVANVPKFTLNALTGDATFAGTLAAGVVVVSGALTVGTNVGLGTAQDASGVTTIVGNTVTTGYVNALNVQAKTVAADWVYAGNISANNITSGTLSGITVKTSSNNERIELTNDTIKFYVGNSLKATIDGSSAGNGGVKNTGDFFIANNKSYWIAASGGGSSDYGGISITNGDQFWLTLGTNNTFYIKNNDQNDNYFTVSYDRAYHRAEFQVNKITSNSGELALDPDGSNKVAMYGNIDMKNNNIDECTTIWAYNFSNRSDLSLKSNVKQSNNNLGLISKLNPVTFNWKKSDNKSHHGLIAQEVEKILPDMVITDDKGIKGINYMEIVPILIGSIKELQQEIIQLKKLIK